MVQPNTEDDDDQCVETGEDREDRNVRTKNRFDSLQLDVKCPNTAVLLLGSRERTVLVAAAAALTKFAAKGKENVQRLFELDIVESLVPLVEHEDLITRRFAARLLAELSAVSFVRNYLSLTESRLEHFTKIAALDPDAFMREYASLVLAEISEDPCGAAKIAEHCSNLDFLLENLKDPDPDIKKNNARVVDNLMKDLTGADRIVCSPVFNFPLICGLLEEPYPDIRSLALSVLESLVVRTRHERVQQLFRESGTLRILVNLLENVEFADAHPDILRVLSRALEDPATAETFVGDQLIPRLFGYFEASTKSRESRDVMEVLVRLGNTRTGSEILYNLGLVKYLFGILRGPSQDQETKRIACHGIAAMSRYEPAVQEIVQENPAKLILDILTDESLTWSVREAATFALKQLCIVDQKMCQVLLELNGPTYLERLLKETPAKVPAELGMASVDILTLVGGYPDLRMALVDAELVESLCAPFEVEDRASDELKIASCRALSTFCLEKRARELCLVEYLPEKLFRLVSSVESTPVRAAVVQLVQQLAGDPAIAEQFIRAGCLTFMMKNRGVAAVVPSWNTCIDSLLSVHLPVKFAMTGRISLHETTEDGFYVMRRQICPFPILDELFRRKMCPKEAIYVVNFADPNTEDSTRKMRMSGDSSSLRFEEKFGKLQKDPYLLDHLKVFRCILAANEPLARIEEPTETGRRRQGLVDISKIASRARLLGRFVARQMAGPDPENPCVDHQLDIHVEEIRDDMETSVIPLGQLRLGGYLERALLFKALADRVCLPVSLVRGEYGKAWNEIAIPQMELPVEDDPRPSEVVREFVASSSSVSAQRTKSTDFSANRIEKDRALRELVSRSILPTSLLCQNYIVDLMDEPGDLMLIDSSRARAYCGPVDKRCVHSCEL